MSLHGNEGRAVSSQPDDLPPFPELAPREWSSASLSCRGFKVCVGMSCVLCVSVGEQVPKLSGRGDDLQMTRLEMIHVLPLLW